MVEHQGMIAVSIYDSIILYNALHFSWCCGIQHSTFLLFPMQNLVVLLHHWLVYCLLHRLKRQSILHPLIPPTLLQLQLVFHPVQQGMTPKYRYLSLICFEKTNKFLIQLDG